MIFLSCPPVYTLPGTWTKCEHALIPHFEFNVGPSLAVFLGLITIGILIYSTTSIRKD
jgi:hypothetical protein|tara:strand:+ start:412 stop:585 length:174 start_codon:yes stop_codon:yes gene_type:complete